MKGRPHITSCIAGLVLCLLASGTARAIWPKTESDFALLPPYCKVRLHEDRYPELARKWKRLLGKSTYLHVHHYCNGLFKLMKARLSLPPNQGLLRSAMREWEYVDKNWPADAKLRPEMLVKRGDTLLLLGQPGDALADYQAAMRLKPDYSLPYLRMADYFLDLGEKDKAREWLEKGREQAPRSRKIRRRLEKLNEAGGDGP